MKKRLPIVGIIAIALFVCFSGCQENNSNNGDKNISGFSTYEDIENGFSIEYPTTWNKYENPSQVQDVNVLFTSPSNEPTKTGNLMVSVFADVNMIMDDFKNAHVENLSMLVPDYNLISEESITFSGLPGYEITFTFTNDIFTWRQLEVWTINENTLYLLVHQADQAFYENFADDIEHMILSFEIIDANNQNGDNQDVSDGYELLQTVCQTVIDDYPEWTKLSSDIIIWENLDKSFKFRNSPEDMSTGIDSPISSSETLVDMDFIGLNEISYVKTQDDKWHICLFKLNGMDAPDNSIIYNGTDSVSSIDVSPINKNEFIVFYTTENNAFVEYLDITESIEENLLETSLADTNNEKLAVSPQGNYVYLLYSDILRIFDIASKTKLDEINFVESVVWVGDSYLIYSTSDKTYIYDINSKEKSEVSKMGSVYDLSFNPKNNGVLAYTEQGIAKTVNCGTWQTLGSTQNAEIKTLANEQTAIMEKEDFLGYWRFDNADWTVSLSNGFSNFATVWKIY